MIEIKVTISTPDLSQAIVQMAAALKGRAEVPEAKTAELVIPAGTPMQVTGIETVKAEPVKAEEVPAAVPEPATQPAAPSVPVAPTVPVASVMPQPAPAPAVIDLDAISRAGAGLVDQGKMADIMAVLKKYGVMAITQLKEDQFAAFAADLRALGANI